MVLIQRCIQRHICAADRRDRANFVTGWAIRSSDDHFVANIPTGWCRCEDQRCVSGDRMPGKRHLVSRRGSMNFSLALQYRPTTELFRIPCAINHSIVSKHNSGSDVSRNWTCCRAHFESTMRRTDDRVDPQLGVNVVREIQRTVNTDRFEFGRYHGIDRQGHALRNNDPSPGRWQSTVLPDGRVGPAAGGDNCVGGLVG